MEASCSVVLIQDNRQVFKDNVKVDKSPTYLHTHTIDQSINMRRFNQVTKQCFGGGEGGGFIQQAFEIYSREMFYILTNIIEPKID